MKNIIISYIMLIILSGCDSSDFNPKPSGYSTCAINPIIKGENNITYIPMYEKHSRKTALYTIEGDLFVKSNVLVKDIVSTTNLGKDDISGVGTINIDNVFYRIIPKSNDDFNYKESYTLSMIEMPNKGKKIGIKTFVDTYYNSRIDLNKVISEISQVTDYNTYLLPISIYPDGLYIVYPSKTSVKFSRGANPGSIGYKISYYRYYPANNPQQYIDIKIPCKADKY